MNKGTVWKVVKGAATVAAALVTVAAEVAKEIWRQHKEQKRK